MNCIFDSANLTLKRTAAEMSFALSRRFAFVVVVVLFFYTCNDDALDEIALREEEDNQRRKCRQERARHHAVKLIAVLLLEGRQRNRERPRVLVAGRKDQSIIEFAPDHKEVEQADGDQGSAGLRDDNPQ